MKQKNLLLLLVFICSISIFSCSKINNKEEINSIEMAEKKSGFSQARLATVAVAPDSNTILLNYVTSIAGLHNPGLDSIYKKVQIVVPTIGVKDSLTARKVVTEINSGTSAFISDQLGSQNLGFSTIVLDRNFYKFDYTIDKIKDVVAIKIGKKLSPALGFALDTVQMYITSSTDTNALKITLNNFLTIKIRSLSNTIDKITLAAIVKVALKSMTYWCANLEKWNMLMYGTQTIISARLPWGNIVKDAVFDDAVGAGIGVIRGALIGAGGGTLVVPFIGTVGGAVGGGLVGMAGGALSGSASSVVWSVVKGFLGW